ncbi:MAG: Oligopeptide transport system permease protein OppC [Chlamydiales bacterium]|nr:Oligopeptide transport system permease protein OppC [Chlamydiales bacterium]MCH9635231.1 Oligopeptide transport system permease protein OppC [Chlamydiales bacterium]
MTLMQKPTSDLFEPLIQDEECKEEISTRSLSYLQDSWRRLRQNPVALAGLSVLAILTLLAIVGPMISSHTYYSTNLALKNHVPCKQFWFGTDDLGRDIFARICLGARISLFVGVMAALIDLVVGVLWGGVAALIGGRIDSILMRTADVLNALPYLLVVIMLMVVMGSGLVPIIIALTMTGWIGMARIVRGQIMQLKEQEFILAATALGAGNRRILFKHLIPNAMGPIIVTMTLTIPIAIFTEAFLSFLGLGVQAPIASWGTMASDGLPAMRYYPWRLFFPAFFISVTMLAFNLLGDGLRDALDPKQRK